MIIEQTPIDIVIPFVDFSDPAWQEDFKSRGGQVDETSINGVERFRDNGTLRVLLRSIKRFMPWYHKIYLIVSHPSQVPDYAKSCCEIILHSDFIPKEFNPPVFSSSAIETWLGNLNVGEYFIYFNDDIILTRPWRKKECICLSQDGMVIPRNIINIKSNCSLGGNTIDNIKMNTFELITGIKGTRQGVNPPHGPHVFKLSWCKECLEKYYEEFHKSCVPLKRTDADLSQYAYMFYQYIYHQSDQYTPNGIFLTGIKYTRINPAMMVNMIKTNNVGWVCLNDHKTIDIFPWINAVEEYICSI